MEIKNYLMHKVVFYFINILNGKPKVIEVSYMKELVT